MTQQIASRSRVRRPLPRPEVTESTLLEGLNPEQREVVLHHEGPLLCAAIAGAGKTTALVRRIAMLHLRHGVDPSQVLALTFSKKAAEEMTSRLVSLLPGEVASKARVGTFHSLAHQFLREEWPEFRSWQLDDRDRFRVVVKDVLGFKGMRWDSADLTVVEQFIGRCKANCHLPGSPEAFAAAEAFYAARPCAQRTPSLLAEAYDASEHERRARRLVTFDDMLLEMWWRMSNDERTRARWAGRWSFVMQDEAQDENRVQSLICEMLAGDHRNYMIVGDPAQSIYGFRGADPSGILSFEAKWGARRVELHRNYRSGSAIIEAANGLLRSMTEGTTLGTMITPERGVDGEVQVRSYLGPDDEAQGVVGEMQEIHADGDVKWAGMVCLYRTNAQSRALEEQLLGARIPYVVIGGTNFYERKEVKDVLAYLRLAAGRGTFEDVRRSINAPFRFLGKEFVTKIEDRADRMGGREQIGWTEIVADLAVDPSARLQVRQRESARSWCRIVDEMSRTIAADRDARAADPTVPATALPSRLIDVLLMETDYVSWLTRDEGSESPENNRVANIRELVRSAERFNTVGGLLDYIDETIEAAQRARAGEEGIDRVTLMSIHKSKGLEWPVVFVVGASERLLPHGKAEDINEERRLAYVAMTRARDVLHVSYTTRAVMGNKSLDLEASRFIGEAGLDGGSDSDPGEDDFNADVAGDIDFVEPA